MSNIELNLDAPSFQTGLRPAERWQQQAAATLVRALRLAGRSAKTCADNKLADITLHNAILVTGPRGTGKTVFLKNARQFWEEQADLRSQPVLHFCKEIDPTLLVDRDNFANVIIAHLFNEVSTRLKSATACGEDTSNFYSKLEDLASALGNAEHSDSNAAGIDRIISYRSGIQLEQRFNDFTKATMSLLKVDAIVMPIDDVDMALGRAFEVLDVVRRLLGCAYIIPLVSGDLALYRPIIDDHFVWGGRQQVRRSLLSKNSASELSLAYLTKLFPIENRIQLLPLGEISAKLVILEGGNPTIAHEYFKAVGNAVCPLVNGEEHSRSWPEPKTARELEQLCRILSPSFLLKKKSALSEFWYRYQTLAVSRHHGAGQLTAEAERALLAWRHDSVTVPRLAKLAAFNLLAQGSAQKGESDEKPYFNQLDHAITEMRLSPTIERSQRQFIVPLQDKSFSQRSMPVLEIYADKLQVPKFRQQLEPDSITPHHRNLFDLYCHHAMYGTSRRTSAQVFFGRAFELLALSLLIGGISQPDGNVARTGFLDSRRDWWVEILNELIARPPFHSVYAIAPTKTFDSDDESGENDDDGGPNGTPSRTHGRQESEARKNLATDIVVWEQRCSIVLRLAQDEGLITLLHYVFNKVFTQTHLLRVRSAKILENDKLTDVASRFEYIVVNAFATFLKVGVVQQNTAHTSNVALLRDPAIYGQKDPSFRDNVVNWIGARGKPLPESATLSQKLLQNIWTHPLFDLHRGSEARFELTRPERRSKQVKEEGALADSLLNLLRRTKKAWDQMSETEASEILKEMKGLATAQDVSLDDFYSKSVRGRAAFIKLRSKAGPLAGKV